MYLRRKKLECKIKRDFSTHMKSSVKTMMACVQRVIFWQLKPLLRNCTEVKRADTSFCPSESGGVRCLVFLSVSKSNEKREKEEKAQKETTQKMRFLSLMKNIKGKQKKRNRKKNEMVEVEEHQGGDHNNKMTKKERKRKHRKNENW
jgi:hypothetical protein